MGAWARTAVVVAAMAVCVPAVAAAQEPVRDFAQLNTRLAPGETVWVTDAQGREVKGRILSLGAEALTLEGRGDRTFGAHDVATVTVRRNDSLSNGAWIGLGIGGSLSLVGCLASTASDDRGWCALAAAVYAGIGAGIGVGIDAMIPGKKLVAYRAPASTGSAPARLSIAPFITPRAKGVALSFAF